MFLQYNLYIFYIFLFSSVVRSQQYQQYTDLMYRNQMYSDQVYRLDVQNENQVQGLNLLSLGGVDFWTRIGLGAVDVRVKSSEKEIIVKEIEALGIKYSILIKDLDKLIEDSYSWVASRNKRTSSEHNMDWETYHPLEDMHNYMNYLANIFDFVSVESIGHSYEGRDMKVLAVCRGGCGDKPAIWIDGGIHPREWVSPAVVTYMMLELIELDIEHPQLTQYLDWYILPSMNPDGYAYTLEVDRMWKKTRSPSDGGCFGADSNRNWDYKWNNGELGASSDPCTDTYMGKEAFSEIENQNVRDFILERRDQIKFFNTIHSYSQMILLPWGFTKEQPDNYSKMEALANTAVAELTAVHESNYTVGCFACQLFIASGGNLDWALGEAQIPYSFGMELRDTGEYAFLLPPSEILPTGEETWAFHAAAAKEIIKEFVTNL